MISNGYNIKSWDVSIYKIKIMNLIAIVSKLGGFTRNSVRKFDLFSQKIMFTYKGESSFSTFFGGLVSIVILSIVAAYFGYLMQIMVNRQSSNNYLSTEIVDLTTEDQDYYPFESIRLIYIYLSFINKFFI